MAYGLDVGTEAIRVAREGEPALESIPAVAFETDAATLESAGLSPASLATVPREDRLVVVGRDAERAAEAVGDVDAVESLLPDGLVDESSRRAVDAALGTLLEGGGAIRYAAPAAFVDGDGEASVHRDAIDALLADRGFEPTPVSTGFAVVYDHLADDDFTGLGVCIEAGSTGVALSYYGVPVVSFSLRKGGEWIVERASEETGRPVAAVAETFESFELDPDAATGEVESALARAHDAVLEEVIDAIRTEAGEDADRGIAVPVAVAGERAIPGVESLVGGRLDAADVPFSVRGVRRAEDPATSPVRGALAAAADGVEGYEAVAWKPDDGVAGGSDDPAGPNAAASAASLSFDESALDREAGGTADAAIESLFERLGAREEAVDALSGEVSELADDLAELEAATDESIAAVADDVATVEAGLADLETIADRTTDLDERVGTTEERTADLDDRVSTVESRARGLAGRLEERAELTESRLDGIEQRTEDRASELDERIDRVTTRLDALEASVDAVEDAAAGVDDLATVRDEVEAIDERLGTLASELEALSDRTTDREAVAELRSDLESADDEVASVRERLASTDDEVADVRADLSEFEGALADVRSRIDERRANEGVAATVADLESRVASLESSVESVSAEADASRDGRAGGDDSVAALSAGGGGAGVVAGGALAAGGDPIVGLGAVGVGLALLAVALYSSWG